jgi:hypothetical protein
MTTFQLIINKILKIENNIFFTNIEGVDSTIRCFFSFDMSIKDTSIPLYKSKFELFKNGMNSFMIKGYKEEYFLSYFNKIQRVYHTLNRFAYIYKFKKAPIVVNTDMTLNELQENEKNVICIYQESSRYLFKIYDLLRIINMSLTNPQGLFSNPLCIKNPYNNLPFSKNILYYIYYFIKEKTNIASNITYTELFFKFHDCNFSLTIFLSKYEYLLRDRIIENYVNNSTQEKLYSDIMSMLRTFNSKNIKNSISIEEKFPKNKIIEIFKPYLMLYMNGNLSLIPCQKIKASCDWYKKLKKFQKFNPLFGRAKIMFKKQICKNGKIKKFKDVTSFNDNHINFYDYDNNNFFKDHLSYRYVHYSDHMIDEDDDHYNESNDDEDSETSDNEIRIIVNSSQFIYEDEDEDEHEDDDDDDEDDVHDDDVHDDDVHDDDMDEVD